tara:strand:+ start:267 stop:497 length:231 start_codon:yes stop_codon:yes gene_type:complete
MASIKGIRKFNPGDIIPLNLPNLVFVKLNPCGTNFIPDQRIKIPTKVNRMLKIRLPDISITLSLLFLFEKANLILL